MNNNSIKASLNQNFNSDKIRIYLLISFIIFNILFFISNYISYSYLSQIYNNNCSCGINKESKFMINYVFIIYCTLSILYFLIFINLNYIFSSNGTVDIQNYLTSINKIIPFYKAIVIIILIVNLFYLYKILKFFKLTKKCHCTQSWKKYYILILSLLALIGSILGVFRVFKSKVLKVK